MAARWLKQLFNPAMESFLLLPRVNAFVIYFNDVLSSLLQFCEVRLTIKRHNGILKEDLAVFNSVELAHLDFVAQYGCRIGLIKQENDNVA